MEEVDEFGIPIKKPSQKKQSVDEFGIPIKKKVGTEVSTSTSTSKTDNTELAPKNGSLESPSPKYRLPNDSDFAKMQKQGVVAPNSELRNKKTQEVDDENIYDLNPDGTKKAPKKPVLNSITQTNWNTLQKKQNKPIITKETKLSLPEGYVQKIPKDLNSKDFTEELYNFTEKDKEVLRKEIDSKIEDNDLNLDNPYLFYSTFNKQESPKDNFIESNFGEEKLKTIGIDVADFDGFLNKKGYKNEFLNKQEKGLFDGKGSGKEGYDIQFAKEREKKRLLDLYIGENNARKLLKTKLQVRKSNLDVAGKDAINEEDLTPTTIFDQENLKKYIKEEMPVLSKKIEQAESESKEIYKKHKSGDANLLYGTEQFFKRAGYGFLDKINQVTTTIYDSIGADERAQALRFLNEERQISKPKTRDVGYAKGLTTKKEGRDYLFTEDGRVIDQELKIDVTDLLEKYEYDSIKFSAKDENKSDYTFSPQGSIIQLGGVAGDMIVQLALTRSLSNVAPSLSKIPVSKDASASIITQSALGYTQGANETYKQAIEAGINEDEARVIANEAGQNMAILYGITAPLSPQTKATQALFGAEGKELIKKSIASYVQKGKGGFIQTLKSGLKTIPRGAAEWIEEGLIKEGSQELTQQAGESYVVNKRINEMAGQKLAKDYVSGDDIVNTLILTTLTGGLSVVPKMFSKTDVLSSYNTLSKDSNFEKNLNDLVDNGVVTKNQAEKLKRDVEVFKNQSSKIPKNLNKDIAMDVMSDLQDISDLESKKKGLDKSFHEEIDVEIEAKRNSIREKIKSTETKKSIIDAELKPQEIVEQKPETQPQTKEQEKVAEVENVSLTNEGNKLTSIENIEVNATEILNPSQIKATQEQFDRIKLVKTPDGTFNVVEEQEGGSSFMLKFGLTEVEANAFLDEINPNKINETASPTNTPTDGNVQPRPSSMEQVGIEQKPTAEITPEESVQSANDVKPTKGKTKITKEPTLEDISNFLNENFKPNEANKGTKETSPEKDTKIRSGEKQNPESDKKEVEVAKKWSLKGRTPMNKRKFKGDMAKANAIEPSDVRSMVLSHFLRGAKVASSEISQQGELKAKNNGFYGIATSKGKTIDAIVHDIWESEENQKLKIESDIIKDMVLDVISMHDKVQDIAESILKGYGIEVSENKQEFQEDLEIYQEVLEEEKPSEQDLMEANLLLAQMTDAEILELVSEQEKSYEDYLKDLEERQVIFEFGPFVEQKGTIQPDGNIITDNGDFIPKEVITKIEYANKKEVETLKQEVKKTSKPDATLLKEVDKKIEDARQKVRVAKDALDRKAKSLDKEMVKDQENLFGERKSSSEAKLFDERVNADAREKATETERNNIKIAQEELKSLIQTKKDIESGKITSNQVDLEDVVNEENKQSEYKFSNTPSLKNAQAIDSSVLPITPKATDNILKNENSWDKAIVGNVKNLGNGWFEVGKTVKGESILYSPTTDKAVTIIDSENKGGRNAVYVNDFIENNPTISEKQQRKETPKEKIIKVYHGGNLDGKGKFEDGNFYVAKDKSQAEAYTKENRGKVFEYEIDENKLLEESVAREILVELDIQPRDGYDVDELGLHEILDDRFDTSITEDDFNKFRKEVEKRGFIGISFTDEDITQRNKFGVENAVIFNPKALFNTKQQRKEKANAEVDKIAQKVKDLLPGINDPDLNKQGFSQDQLIDLVANAVKNLISAGIEIDEAIRQVASSIKDRFGIDVNPDDVKAKLEPKVEQEPFERKEGKKSGLTRAATGNNANVKKAIAKYSLDYEIESQEVAKANAERYVAEVGIETAFESLKPRIDASGNKYYLISGAESAFVYAEVIRQINANLENFTDEQLIEFEETNMQMLGETQKMFDEQSRSAGRFLSALGKIYQSSDGMYNLSIQVKKYKANNGGTIPADILEKYTEANEKIKELEKQIEEANKIKEEQESVRSIENLIEAISRKSKIDRSKPISDKAKAKAFADKLRSFKSTSKGTLNAATPLSLTFDAAIELIATSIEAGGKISDAIKKGIEFIRNNSLLSEDEKNQATAQVFNAFEESERVERGIKLDDEGKLRIPHSILREKVESGIDNVDDLVKSVKEDVDELFPDEEFTEREIRDAITQYGKTVNPTYDEIGEQLSIMKSLGKMLSATEDAYEGKRPLKSGLQRRPKTTEERAAERKLKELMRDLPFDEADLRRAYKTALDAIKSRLTNEIADLDQQIANGEKRKGEKKAIEYDAEANALKAERDQKRQILDELVGKPELTEEERIEKAEILLEKSINDLQEKIDSGDIAYRTKPTPLNSAKLTSLREQKKAMLKTMEQMRQDAGLAEKKRILDELVGKPELTEEERIEKAEILLEKSINDLQEKIDSGDIAYRTKPTPLNSAKLTSLREQKKAMLKTMEQMRQDAGLAEKKRIELAKNARIKRIAELKRRLDEKDFSKKERKPLPIDVELDKLDAEVMKWKEVYDKEAYKLELKNRTINQKIGKLLLEILNIPKILSFTIDMSFIGIQGGIQFYRLLRTKPRKAMTIFANTVKAMFSPKMENKYANEIKSDPNYTLWKKADLAVTEVNYKTSAQEELFQHNIINGALDALGDRLEKNGYPKFGAFVRDYLNFTKIFERGQTYFLNQMRINRFNEGATILRTQGKNEFDDIKEYKKVAAAVNTLTGRANTSQSNVLANLRSLNGTVFSSFANWLSVINQLNPYWYVTLTPTARKMAISDLLHFVGAVGGFMSLAMLNSNEDDEEPLTIELDPRSSDFGLLKKGNLRIDPWQTKKSHVVFMARMMPYVGGVKNAQGEIVEFGVDYNDKNRLELAWQYMSNKFSPGVSNLIQYTSMTEEKEYNGVKFRENRFGEDYKMSKMFIPLYIQSFQEVMKEEPELYGKAVNTLNYLGLVNVGIYGGDDKGVKNMPDFDEFGNRNIKSSQSERPERKERTERKER
jgi:hypothetical protein